MALTVVRGGRICAGAGRRARGRRLGSDGSWVEPLEIVGLNSTPLHPANCRICRSIGRKNGRTVRGQAAEEHKPVGECAIRARRMRRYPPGLEGGVVYTLSLEVGRLFCAGRMPRTFAFDLQAGRGAVEILRGQTRAPARQSQPLEFLAKSGAVSKPSASLCFAKQESFRETRWQLARLIKSAPVERSGASPGLIAPYRRRAASFWSGLDENLMSKSFPGLFVAGEMLDWDSADRRLFADGLFCHRSRGGSRRGAMAQKFRVTLTGAWSEGRSQPRASLKMSMAAEVLA